MKIPVAGLEVHVVSAAGDLIASPLPGRAAQRQTRSAPTRNGRRRTTRRTTSKHRRGRGVRPVPVSGPRDLTWKQEVELVCPQNRWERCPFYRTSRHGGEYSGAQALVHSVRARVAVMNNNPTKGGTTRPVPHREGAHRDSRTSGSSNTPTT